MVSLNGAIVTPENKIELKIIVDPAHKQGKSLLNATFS